MEQNKIVKRISTLLTVAWPCAILVPPASSVILRRGFLHHVPRVTSARNKKARRFARTDALTLDRTLRRKKTVQVVPWANIARLGKKRAIAREAGTVAEAPRKSMGKWHVLQDSSAQLVSCVREFVFPDTSVQALGWKKQQRSVRRKPTVLSDQPKLWTALRGITATPALRILFPAAPVTSSRNLLSRTVSRAMKGSSVKGKGT